MKAVIKVILVISVIVCAFSFFQKDKLPDREEVLDDLYKEPVQKETKKASFKTTVKEVEYTIKPLYDYELYGLVVTYHHSDAFADYYHGKWKDYLNIKDICVVYGDNIKSRVYQDLKFSSGSWTCHAKGESEAWSIFKNSCLSNNHLLSDNEEINNSVKSAKNGDQIYFKGYLAEYSHSEGFRRGSSTSRDDKGNGACETIYLTDFKIIKKGNPFWRFVYDYSKYSIIGCIVLLIIIFFKSSAYGKRKKLDSKTNLGNGDFDSDKYKDLLTRS